MVRVQLPSALAAAAPVRETQAECAPFQERDTTRTATKVYSVCVQRGGAAVQCIHISTSCRLRDRGKVLVNASLLF